MIVLQINKTNHTILDTSSPNKQPLDDPSLFFDKQAIIQIYNTLRKHEKTQPIRQSILKLTLGDLTTLDNEDLITITTMIRDYYIKF